MAKELPRLQELLTQETGDFAVELEFMYSPSHLPMISGKVKGTVALECQRCLEAVCIDLDTRLDVVVTASQTDRRPEEEGYEICIVEDERLFLQDFIEDEILLALPVVPRHNDCQPVKTLREASADDVGNEHRQQETKENPFAALKDWKKTE
ncbi:MAG: YceD family protein [Thiolinea sp.]